MAKKYTKVFQQEAVRISLSSDLSGKQTATDLGIGFSTLSRWIQIHRHRDDVRAPSDIGWEQEAMRLRKENRILKEERDILKKATQYFAPREYCLATLRARGKNETVCIYTPRAGYALEQHGGDVATERLCQMLRVTSRGFRAWRSPSHQPETA